MKRQDYVFGSTSDNVEEQSTSALNNGWAELSILYSRVLNGVCAALSQSTNAVSQEVANAIAGMGVTLNESDSSQLLKVLQTLAIKASDFQTPITADNKGATMKEIEDVVTSSLTFKGFVSATEPSGNLEEGNLWINASSMPTTIPIASALIKEWNGTSWVAYGSAYTPANFDFFRNNNDNEGYYWFAGQWKVMSTDLSTEYFTLNQTSGKWEIKNSVNLPGTPTVNTPDASNTRAVVNVDFVNNNAISSRNFTNALTEIPQDINLELTNGTLTLKAGSKVYVPNGAGVFNAITIANDISHTITWASNSTRLLFVKNNGTGLEEREFSFSGPTAPTSKPYSLWYDTTNNAVKYTSDSGSTWVSGNSFPIALITSTNNVITSIDRVFNGVGYVGASIFALPGLKYLIPNGRNSDGSLKSISVTLTKVHTGTLTYGAQPYYFALGSTGNIVFAGTKVTKYDEDNNIVIDTYAKKTVLWALLGTYNGDSNHLISSWNPKDVFHAVDYDDVPKHIATLLQTIYPVGSIYIGTQSTCPMSAVIPGSTWQLVSSGRALWTGNGSNANTTIAPGVPNIKGSFSTPDGQEASGNGINDATGAFYRSDTNNDIREYRTYGLSRGSLASFNASRVSSVYRDDVDTVQPPAYVVNVWRRTA